MNTDVARSDIFKFVALRPPDSVDRSVHKVNFITDDRQPEKTPVGKLIKSLAATADPSQIPGELRHFVDEHQYTDTFLLDDSVLVRINDFLKFQALGSDDRVVAGIVQIVDSSVAEYYNSEETQNQIHETWDRYYAFYVLGRSEPQNLEHLTHTLRLFHIVHLLADNMDLSGRQTFLDALAATPLVPKIYTELPKSKPKPAVPRPEPSAQTVTEYKQLWADLVNTHRALDEIGNLRYEMKTFSETRKVAIPNKETGLSTPAEVSLFKNSVVVDPSSFAGLHASTKSLLKGFSMKEQPFQLADTIAELQKRVMLAHQAIGSVDDIQFLSYMPPEAKQIPGIAAVVDKLEPNNLMFPRPIPTPPSNIRSSIKPLGIGDLKVVKQKLVKYSAGEIAHIENVLRGEYKERKHRVLDRTEESLVIMTETEEEATRDTQTTDRFELKKESENTLQEQMSLQAGVTVTGSYGMVTFGAHGDFAYSTASSQSNKSSSNFAKEVVDRSVSRVQKKVKEERTAKNLHEVEELNTHGLDNKDKSDHMIGIYRWVDKHYQAQIYNYGKRLMFEFIIPEPAAYYIYAIANRPKSDIAPPKVFTFKFTDITEHNYMDFVTEYNVQGVTPPPIPWKTVSTSLTKDEMELVAYKAHVLVSKELIVPDGYWSSKGVGFDCSAYFSGNPRLEITIGNKVFRLLDASGSVGAVANNANNDEIKFAWFTGGNSIPISVNSYDVVSYTINAFVFVEQIWETYQKWQIQTWEKIASAHQALKDDYEQKVAAQQNQAGVVIKGQNAAINRETEKTELKKHCAKLLMDIYQFGSFDAMKQKDLRTPPDFDIFDALAEGRIIQFFEQAFEWENITYLFFPYFWGRYSEWISKVNMSDADPLFTKFLQAGSAKVVVPVHPAYNDAVMYFLENNGSVWRGGDTPRLNDPMFISIAEEMRNQTDDLAGARPEGDPWEVVLPTTLVCLQKDGELPAFGVSP